MITGRLHRHLIKTNRSDPIQTLFLSNRGDKQSMSPLLSINTTHGYFSYAFSLTVFQAALLPHMAACPFYYVPMEF